MYVVTVSMPGYLPESDPYECEELSDAQEVARDEVERLLDFHAEAEDEFTAEVIELEPGRSWHVGTDRPHDLGIVIEIHDSE